MFQKILVAIDGSDASLRAFERAVDEARVWSADLSVIYVIETGMFSSIPLDNTLEVIYNLLEQEGRESLEYCRKTAEKEGVNVQTCTRQGHAGNEILRFAEEMGADLIVLGPHGRSEVDRLLLGSVTDHVVRHSPITTMVVRV